MFKYAKVVTHFGQIIFFKFPQSSVLLFGYRFNMKKGGV